jgi:hypothetical protein
MVRCIAALISHNQPRPMTANRIAGIVLISIGLLGFLTVADDLRHVGEVVGVSSIVLAGAILLSSGLKINSISPTIARSSAIGVFPGMVLGAGLDHMLIGVALGLSAGIVVGVLMDRRRRSTRGNAP